MAKKKRKKKATKARTVKKAKKTTKTTKTTKSGKAKQSKAAKASKQAPTQRRGPGTGPPPTTVITFRCDPDSKRCVEDPERPQHIGEPGTPVRLEAINTKVTIDFTSESKGSPFSSGKKFIEIEPGTPYEDFVKDGASKEYRYKKKTCDACDPPPDGPDRGTPDMIVP